jgi:acyl phosphate:glycerol-3-phosphate acyltransferase
VTTEVVLLLVGAYVLGAIPFGVLIAKALAGVDITGVGSGNIGATNVHRVLGWKASLPVMVLDIGKGLVPPLIAKGMNLSWEPTLPVIDIALIAGLAAVLGHCTSPFLKFKGGKGVATICGAAIGATPPIALAGIVVFAFVTLTTRYISLASITAVLATVVAAYLLRYDGLIIGSFAAISLFIMYKHRSNVRRLLKGEEPKFRFKGDKKPSDAEPMDNAPIPSPGTDGNDNSDGVCIEDERSSAN